MRCALVALLDDLPAELPVLLLATAELPCCPSSIARRSAAASAVGGGGMQLPLQPAALPLPAAGGSSSASSSEEQQQQQRMAAAAAAPLEQLGLDAALGALFPCAGGADEVLLTQQHRLLTQQHRTGAAAEQPAPTTQQQEQQQQLSLLPPGARVLGRVLLGPIGADERRLLFKVWRPSVPLSAHHISSNRDSHRGSSSSHRGRERQMPLCMDPYASHHIISVHTPHSQCAPPPSPCSTAGCL